MYPRLLIALVSQLALIAPFVAAAIHNCDSFQAWFHTQPASLLTLVSGAQDVPEPKSKTLLVLDMSDATWWKGHVGGGGCLSEWYDPVHQLVALEDDYDTYQDFLIFKPTSIPVGVRTRDLSDVTLDNGLHLGMSRARIEALKGKGLLTALPDGESIRYGWIAEGVKHDLSFLFEKIDLLQSTAALEFDPLIYDRCKLSAIRSTCPLSGEV